MECVSSAGALSMSRSASCAGSAVGTQDPSSYQKRTASRTRSLIGATRSKRLHLSDVAVWHDLCCIPSIEEIQARRRPFRAAIHNLMLKWPLAFPGVALWFHTAVENSMTYYLSVVFINMLGACTTQSWCTTSHDCALPFSPRSRHSSSTLHSNASSLSNVAP